MPWLRTEYAAHPGLKALGICPHLQGKSEHSRNTRLFCVRLRNQSITLTRCPADPRSGSGGRWQPTQTKESSSFSSPTRYRTWPPISTCQSAPRRIKYIDGALRTRYRNSSCRTFPSISKRSRRWAMVRPTVTDATIRSALRSRVPDSCRAGACSCYMIGISRTATLKIGRRVSRSKANSHNSAVNAKLV